jgi:hypothetical protein
MLMAFSSFQAREYLFLLSLALGWNESHDRGSDHLLGRAAEAMS